MLIHEVPGVLRIVYVHAHRAGAQGYHGNATRGVLSIHATAPDQVNANSIETPVYVQFRAPHWRDELPWEHVPMSLELFQAFLESPAEDLRQLERSGAQSGILPELLANLMAAPNLEVRQNLEQAILAARAPTPWKEAHIHEPTQETAVWACVYNDYRAEANATYDVYKLVYVGSTWFHESGALSAPPEYFAETETLPELPPVRVFPWRPWV